MSSNDPDGTVYPPKVTKLTGRELSIDEATKSRVFWLLRRYSSLAYIRRQYDLWRAFLDGLEEVGRRSSPKSSGWYIDTLARFLPYRVAYEEGLKLLGGGFAAGYRKILVATEFSEDILSRGFESGLYWEEFGYPYGMPGHHSTGLFAWAERARAMAQRSRITLQAGWAYQRFSEEKTSDSSSPRHALPPLPLPSQLPVIRPNEEIPVSGVWFPRGVINGCPNYLFQGRKAPEAMVAAKYVEWAGPDVPHGLFQYARRPCHWQPSWVDTRYIGGQHPDESEFLDDTTADPSYPPRHEGPAPEF